MANLTYQQFEEFAIQLAAISDKIGDGWALRHVQVCSEPEKVFLVKRSTHQLVVTGENSPPGTAEDEGLLALEDGMEIMDESRDPGIATPPSFCTEPTRASSEGDLSKTTIAHLEYHIVHNQSYQVPILYFNATYMNGRQLAMQDVWALISTLLTSSDTDKWSLVTQQEHPLLHCPFYHIHPCHTAKVMATALSLQDGFNVSVSEDDVVIEAKADSPVCEDRHCLTKKTEASPIGHGNTREQRNYLVSWLSMFGPLIGIRVPGEYSES